MEEALALYRDLADASPTYQPGLANTLNNYGTSLRGLDRHFEALTHDREALNLYAALAQIDPGLYEETYQRRLVELRRAYDLRGDLPASISLHLRRDDKSSEQP